MSNVNQGGYVLEDGVAPGRPAEFMIFRIDNGHRFLRITILCS
jgi:phage tail sheath protein FI